MSANPSPVLAAFLSFIFPGLGQIYAGASRRGLIWALPMLLFIVGVLFLVLGGQSAILAFTDPQKQLALLVLNVAFFLYHVAAMIDAYDVARHERPLDYSRRSSTAPIWLALLVTLAIVIHGVPEVFGIQVYNGYVGLFDSDNTDVIPPPPSFGPVSTPALTPSPDVSATPSATPSGEPTGTPDVSPSGTPSGTPGTPEPTRSPLPPIDLAGWPQWAQDGRLNLLIAGTDSRSDTGVEENSLRTDTMILLSVDIQSGKAAMFGFPRNMCSAVEGDCGEGTRYPDWLTLPLAPEVMAIPAAQARFPSGSYGGLSAGYNYLNALWRYAAQHPEMFPGSEGIGPNCQQQFDCQRGWRAVIGTIQQMSGQAIDGVISVNLKGFTSLVDNLPAQCADASLRVQLGNANCYGGVWIDAPRAVHDDIYHTSQQQQIVVDIPSGCHYFDAEMTLAYARARHETSDYDRSRRQQYVLTQIRKQFDPLALLPHIPALLDVVDQNIFMTIQTGDVQYLAQVASRVDADRIYRVDFAPGVLNKLTSMADLRDLIGNIFSQPEPTPEKPTGGNSCPPKGT